MIIKKFKKMIMTIIGGKPRGIPARPVGEMTVKDIKTQIDGLDDEQRIVFWDAVEEWCDGKKFSYRTEMRITPDDARKILQIQTANSKTDEEKVEALLEFFATDWWDENLMIDILNQCLNPPKIRGKSIEQRTEIFDENELFVGNEWFDPTPKKGVLGDESDYTYIQSPRDYLSNAHVDLLIKANVRVDEGWPMKERHHRRRMMGKREIADVQQGDKVMFHRKQTKGLVPLTGKDLVDLVEKSEQDSLRESIKPISWLEQRLALITSSTVDPYKDNSDGGRYAEWDDNTWDESAKEVRLEETVEGVRYVTNERDEILYSGGWILGSVHSGQAIDPKNTTDDNVISIRKIRYDLKRAINSVTAYPAIINGKIWKEFFDRHPKFREDEWEEDGRLAMEIYESGQLDKSKMASLVTKATKTVKSNKKKLTKKATKEAVKKEVIRLLSGELRSEEGVTVITTNGFKRNARMMYVKSGTSGLSSKWSVTYMVDTQGDKFKEPMKMVEVSKMGKSIPLYQAKRVKGDEDGKWFAKYADKPTDGRITTQNMGFTILVANLTGLSGNVTHHPLKHGILGMSKHRLTVYRQNSLMLPTSRKVVVEEFFSSVEEMTNANAKTESDIERSNREHWKMVETLSIDPKFANVNTNDIRREATKRLKGYRPREFRPQKVYAITRIYEYDIYRGEWKLIKTERHFKPINVKTQTDKASAEKRKTGNTVRKVRTKNGKKETTTTITGGSNAERLAGFEALLDAQRNE